MPILEALKRLCREPGREHLVTLCRQLAPTWLLQMPSLIDPASRKELCQQVGEPLQLFHLLRGLHSIHLTRGELRKALAAARKNGQCLADAWLHWLKGQLVLQSGVRGPESPTPSTHAEAEECFHKAIDVARQKSSKWLELRATVSLSRLWQQWGKRAEAQQMLAEIYGWFTEGFDTANLREARALLEELS